MSENLKNAITADFSAEVRGMVQAIEKNGSNEVAQILVQYMAAFVHPDMVCNMSLMLRLPESDKKACTDFFEYCLRTGLTIEQQGEILRFLRPHLAKVLNICLH